MRDIKYYIALDDFERRVVENCLNEMRNNFTADGKYTDEVDGGLIMGKYIYNKQTGISYTLQSDYCLSEPAFSYKEERPIGIWGQ